MNQKTSKVEKEFYLRCSYLTLSVLFDKEPIFVTILNIYVIFASFDTEEVLFVLEFMLHFSVFRILCSILP
ncbi:hypothetical protein EXW20_15720 [Enterococcus faecium]|nr:hypothetical protein [Enterococcus faecium]